MRTIYGPIFTLRPYERGIQETLGKYSRFVMPGLGISNPARSHHSCARYSRTYDGY